MNLPVTACSDAKAEELPNYLLVERRRGPSLHQIVASARQTHSFTLNHARKSVSL